MIGSPDNNTLQPARHLRSRAVSPRKSILIIDAPTSKAKVVVDLLKVVQTLVGAGTHGDRWCLCVLLGHRFDLLGVVHAAVQQHFRRRHVFLVQCSSGRAQTARMQPTYLLYTTGPGVVSEDVPATATLPTCSVSHLFPFHVSLLHCLNDCVYCCTTVSMAS